MFFCDENVEKGANPRRSDLNEISALHLACRLPRYQANEHDNLVRLLLECSVFVDHLDKTGRAPLHDAITNAHLNTAELLVQHGMCCAVPL